MRKLRDDRQDRPMPSAALPAFPSRYRNGTDACPCRHHRKSIKHGPAPTLSQPSPQYGKARQPVTRILPHHMPCDVPSRHAAFPHQDTKGHRASGMEKRRPRAPGCPRPAARLRQFVPYACSGPFPLLARRRTGVLPHQKETSVLPPVLTSCRDGHAGTAGSPAPSFPRPRKHRA